MKRLHKALLLIAMLPWQGLAGDKGVTESHEAALARIRGEIIQMIGDGRCRNLVHCRLLPLGLSHCAGPSEYLAYSSGFGDSAALETKASEYAFEQGEVQAKQIAPATCVPLPEHQAVCIDNRCRAQPIRK